MPQRLASQVLWYEPQLGKNVWSTGLVTEMTTCAKTGHTLVHVDYGDGKRWLPVQYNSPRLEAIESTS